MAEFEKDAADFKADLVKLGVRILSAGGIAQVVGYSESHVKNLLGGSKRYTPGARTRLGEMIAAKGREKSKHVLEPGQIMPGASIAEEYTLDMGDACESRFHLEGPTDDGGWNVVKKQWVVEHKMIARSWSEDDANRICDLLNKEAG